MAVSAGARRLDPRLLEEHTQAIGRELFAAARREHAHLSVPNRWTQQVLSWCLADPSLKGTILRFIDVLPSLTTARAVAQHVCEYFPATNQRLPAPLRVGAAIAGPGLLTAPVVARVIHELVEQVARQFIAQSRAEGAAELARQLAARGAACSLDVLGEQVLSEDEAEAYARQYHGLLRDLAGAYRALTPAQRPRSCGPLLNVSVKPSALTPKFDPISPEASVSRAATRLLPILEAAHREGAVVTLDMEQYELRDLTLALARRALEAAPGPPDAPRLGIVLQAYLRDAETVLEDVLAWVARGNCPIAVRLVKGAYWDFELAVAAQRGWPVPVCRQKSATDAQFEAMTLRLLSAHPRVLTAIASHNVRSIAHAMAAAELLGLDQTSLEFQLLYGMGDALHAAIHGRGYPVRIYAPIGQLIPGMAYLVRRLLENTANESFLRQEFLQERSAEDLLRPSAVLPDSAPAASPATATPFADFSRADQRERFRRAVHTAREQLGRRYPILLGDGTVDASEYLTVRNPARPDEVLGTIAQANLAEVNRAVHLAAAAQPAWAALPVSERTGCLRRAAERMRAQRFDLSAWAVLEVGKSWREADVEIVEAIEYLEYYSEQMERLARGQPLRQVPGEVNRYLYLPRGVAVVIAPWNFPAAILTGMASAALVAGNAVILKPAEESSIMASQLTAILRAAGIPPSVVQMLPGFGHEVGTALVRHPGTHMTLFTGSKIVGLSILKTSAQVPDGQRFVKHVVAEMGGKNAVIIDADADLDAAVQGVITSAFGYAGQKCSAASRVLIHDRVYERVVTRLCAAMDRLVIGDPSDPDTDVGPLITEEAQRRVRDAIQHAGAVGRIVYQYPQARLPKAGYFVPPALAAGIPRQHALMREELFGPLVCLARVPSFGKALELANDTDYALTGGVYSRSPAHLAQAVRAFDVGNLYLNRPITGALVGRQPFGGHRLSGLGTKAGGPDYLLEVLVPKTVTENTARHGMPLD